MGRRCRLALRTRQLAHVKPRWVRLPRSWRAREAPADDAPDFDAPGGADGADRGILTPLAATTIAAEHKRISIGGRRRRGGSIRHVVVFGWPSGDEDGGLPVATHNGLAVCTVYIPLRVKHALSLCTMYSYYGPLLCCVVCGSPWNVISECGEERWDRCRPRKHHCVPTRPRTVWRRGDGGRRSSRCVPRCPVPMDRKPGGRV